LGEEQNIDDIVTMKGKEERARKKSKRFSPMDDIVAILVLIPYFYTSPTYVYID
jgi:hypothetical protein